MMGWESPKSFASGFTTQALEAGLRKGLHPGSNCHLLLIFATDLHR